MLDIDSLTQDLGTGVTIGSGSTRTTLAVCGDPIISRALVLLLRGPDYEVIYLPVASLSVPGTLKDVQILLLAFERETESHNTILELLDSATEADGVHILELTAGLEGGPERRREHAHAERKISWPCSTEHLKWHISTALTSVLLVNETA